MYAICQANEEDLLMKVDIKVLHVERKPQIYNGKNWSEQNACEVVVGFQNLAWASNLQKY